MLNVCWVSTSNLRSGTRLGNSSDSKDFENNTFKNPQVFDLLKDSQFSIIILFWKIENLAVTFINKKR